VVEIDWRLEEEFHFVLGGDLFTYLRQTGKFLEKHVKFYAAQVFLVFEYLHHFDVL
jgi:protein kinase A